MRFFCLIWVLNLVSLLNCSKAACLLIVVALKTLVIQLRIYLLSVLMGMNYELDFLNDYHLNYQIEQYAMYLVLALLISSSNELVTF